MHVGVLLGIIACLYWDSTLSPELAEAAKVTYLVTFTTVLAILRTSVATKFAI